MPDEQIFSPTARTRRLFTDDREADAAVARTVLADLDHPAELRELGTALFLDRPFGFSKAIGEPDQTLLASHVLFSKEVAGRRLELLERRLQWLPNTGGLDGWRTRLRDLTVDGLPLPPLAAPKRPGVVSLADAQRVAGDWLMLHTTRQTLHDLARQYDLRPLSSRFGLPEALAWRLLAPGPTSGSVCIFDASMRRRADIAADASDGYRVRGGVECSAAGLRVHAVWSDCGERMPVEPEYRLLPVL